MIWPLFIGPIITLESGREVFSPDKNDLDSTGDRIRYLNNGVVRLGVAPDFGGSIMMPLCIKYTDQHSAG